MSRILTVLAALALISASVTLPPLSAASATGPRVAVADLETAVLYVATTGDDASQCDTIATPCQTVSGAVTRAIKAITDDAVDAIVKISAGIYNENVAIADVTSGHSLSLVGASAETTIIDGLGDKSVFTVVSGVVNIMGLSITGGVAPSGGGIYNTAGTLTLSETTLTGNTANANGSTGGGGIYNDTGTLTILNSDVSNNTSTGQGYAGGIFNSTGGTVTISDSTVSNNTASWYVGGINNKGELLITRSTVSNNTTHQNFGGGIQNHNGTLTLTDSTLSGNAANGSGGTVKGGGLYNRGSATITNSTLSANTATTSGGAIHNQGNNNSLVVISSTLSDNTAATGAGFRREGGTISFSSSIISASSCTKDSGVIDGGYNVTDICTFENPSGTSVTGSTTIGLEPLAANGSSGPHTMAIDVTSSAHHLVPGCTGTDERGMPRPGFGGTANCDAGAYELQGVAPAVTTDPQSQTFSISSDATFTAAASGTPAPTVQWQANTGDGWADISGATSATLTVTGVTHAMSGTQFRAVFANGVAPDATSAAATMTVPVGALDHLVLSPSLSTIAAGGSQPFTAEGFDSFDNSLGDVTVTTVFTGPTGLECTDATCTSITPGTHTVTGTNGLATGSASVTVGAIPVVPLPGDKPVATGALTDVPATIQPGGQFTATASGFAPHAPVSFGIYSTVTVLGNVIADGNGTAVAHLQIPAGFVGNHTVVAAGMSPSMTALYPQAQTFVMSAVGPEKDETSQQLSATGIEPGEVTHLIATGALLLLCGLLISFVVSRRQRTNE